MTRNEHKEIVTKMLGMVTPENQATASELLTQLTDDYEKTLTTSETLTADNEKLKADFENMRAVNAKLFLRVGETDKLLHNDNQDNANNEDDENKLTYEALFNEKGELI